MSQRGTRAFFAFRVGSTGVLVGPPPMAGTRIADLGVVGSWIADFEALSHLTRSVIVFISHGYFEIGSAGL